MVFCLVMPSWAGQSLRWHAASPWGLQEADSSYLRLSSEFVLAGHSIWDVKENTTVHSLAHLVLESRIPLTHELRLWADYSPQASFAWKEERRDQPIEWNDSTQNISALFDQDEALSGSWSTLRLGTQIHTENQFMLSIALERHSASLSGEGSSDGNLTLFRTTTEQGTSIEERFYQDSDFHSDWQGSYHGSAWGARLQMRWRWLQYEASLGRDLLLYGTYQHQKSLPSFLTGNPFQILDTLVTADSVKETHFATDSSLIFHIPHTHSLAFRNSFLNVSYTWFNTPYSVLPVPDSLRSELDLRKRVSQEVKINHLLLLSTHWNWIGITGGVFFWNGTPEWVANANVLLQKKDWRILGGFDILPGLALHAGVEYEL